MRPQPAGCPMFAPSFMGERGIFATLSVVADVAVIPRLLNAEGPPPHREISHFLRIQLIPNIRPTIHGIESAPSDIVSRICPLPGSLLKRSRKQRYAPPAAMPSHSRSGRTRDFASHTGPYGDCDKTGTIITHKITVVGAHPRRKSPTNTATARFRE